MKETTGRERIGHFFSLSPRRPGPKKSRPSLRFGHAFFGIFIMGAKGRKNVVRDQQLM
jgi:hypothetical protein